MRSAAEAWNDAMQRRRSVRHFSSDPIPLDVVERVIEAASSAPSGAHKQPWTFVLITDPSTKQRIREAAEEEERAFYGGRAGARWLADLAPFETNADKPFLEHAPALIAVFAQKHGGEAGDRHYYVNESVGIAVGFLLAGLHQAGLASLTHTPVPMKFLADVLDRPDHERPYLLIPVGFPADGCAVPDLRRKSLDEVMVRVGDRD
jgi:iodotyrosine deiodinase